MRGQRARGRAGARCSGSSGGALPVSGLCSAVPGGAGGDSRRRHDTRKLGRGHSSSSTRARTSRHCLPMRPSVPGGRDTMSLSARAMVLQLPSPYSATSLPGAFKRGAGGGVSAWMRGPKLTAGAAHAKPVLRMHVERTARARAFLHSSHAQGVVLFMVPGALQHRRQLPVPRHGAGTPAGGSRLMSGGGGAGGEVLLGPGGRWWQGVQVGWKLRGGSSRGARSWAVRPSHSRTQRLWWCVACMRGQTLGLGLTPGWLGHRRCVQARSAPSVARGVGSRRLGGPTTSEARKMLEVLYMVHILPSMLSSLM